MKNFLKGAAANERRAKGKSPHRGLAKHKYRKRGGAHNSGRASFFEKRNPGDSSKGQQIIRITAPIDLSAHLWEPIGNGIDSSLTFCGIFDGGGFPITGMKVVSSAQYAGFFGVVGASGIGPTLLSINLSGNVSNSNSGDTSRRRL